MFYDGFDAADSIDAVHRKWDNWKELSSQSYQYLEDKGRSPKSLRINETSHYLTKYFEGNNVQQIILGLAILKMHTSLNFRVHLMEDDIFHQSFIFNSAGFYRKFNNNSDTSETISFIQNTPNWNFIEFKVKISDTAGLLGVRYNKENLLYQSNVDTKAPDSQGFINKIRIPGGNDVWFDDVYILDDLSDGNDIN
ncbi:hypothetical protein GMMP15_840001 [Candidatus Magnetomoraceae bacterium gMMP-15]